MAQLETLEAKVRILFFFLNSQAARHPQLLLRLVHADKFIRDLIHGDEKKECKGENLRKWRWWWLRGRWILISLCVQEIKSWWGRWNTWDLGFGLKDKLNRMNVYAEERDRERERERLWICVSCLGVGIFSLCIDKSVKSSGLQRLMVKSVLPFFYNHTIIIWSS